MPEPGLSSRYNSFPWSRRRSRGSAHPQRNVRQPCRPKAGGKLDRWPVEPTRRAGQMPGCRGAGLQCRSKDKQRFRAVFGRKRPIKTQTAVSFWLRPLNVQLSKAFPSKNLCPRNSPWSRRAHFKAVPIYNESELGSISLALLFLSTPYSRMLVYQLARVALAAVTLLGQSVTAQKPCRNPSVRREWRSLSAHERADWIDAVKVRNPAGHYSRVTDTSPCPVSQYVAPQLFFDADV